MNWYFCLGLVTLCHVALSQNVDPECGKNITNLWLDVVVVADVAKGMTNDRLWQITNVLLSVFGSGTRIGVNYTDPRNTRIGFVTYSETAKVTADLNTANSFIDFYNIVESSLAQTSTSEKSFIASGLASAEIVFKQGRNGTVRSNYPQLVIVFASDYQGAGNSDPAPIATRLKNSGISILTVACTDNSTTQLNIAALATPGNSFVDKRNTNKLTKEITEATLMSNCVCPKTAERIVQYRKDFDDVTSKKYRVCIFSGSGYSVWQYARDNCQSRIKNGYLANEFDDEKHTFIFRYMQANGWHSGNFRYHIGLSNNNGTWAWEQPVGQKKLPLGTDYNKWYPGYPKPVSSGYVVANQQFSSAYLNTAWGNLDYLTATYYACQVQACDTEHFCN